MARLCSRHVIHQPRDATVVNSSANAAEGGSPCKAAILQYLRPARSINMTLGLAA